MWCPGLYLHDHPLCDGWGWVVAKNNEVGVALLRIAPSLNGFTQELRRELEKLQKSQAWPKAEVNLDLGNARQFQAKVDEAVQRAERREVNINVDVNTGKARAEVEAFKRSAERRGLNLDLHIDDDTALDDLRRQMRSVHEIREDIARAAAEAASSDKDSSDEARHRLGLLREELKLVNDIEAAQKAVGDRAAADRIDERKHLKDRLDGLRAASDIERDILDAKARGDDSARIAAEKELANRKQIASAIQTYERERVEAAQRAADIDAQARQRTARDLADRLGAMRKESDIRRDIADAQLRGDKAHLASLNRELQLRNGLASALRAQVREQRLADQDRRRAAEAEARDRDRGGRDSARIGVVQNFRGLSASGLIGVSSALAGVNALVAALGGVVAAAGAAATALASMGAVGLVGGMGVFKAFSALRQEADSAGSAVEDSANDQARAMDRLSDAQRSVQDAQRDLRDSQKDYATAVKDATRAIRDQNMELQDAVLSQEDAAIGVARARERLAEVNADFRAGRASRLDVQEARLGVRQAQARLKSAQIRVQDSRDDTAEVNAGGVEGHEIVQNARERIDDSHRRLADAQRDVARATRDMAQAMRQAQGPQSEFDKQMAKLSPNARDFVNRIRSLSGAWDRLRFATEQAMFDGLGAEVQKFARDQLPDLQRGMEALAGTMNTVFKDTLKQVGDTFSKFAADGTFSRFITGVQDSFAGFAPTIDALIRTLTGLTIEIGPQIGVFFQQFADFLNDGTQMWAEFGRDTVAGIGGMLPVINDLFESLLPIAAALLPHFAEALQVLTNVISDNEGRLISFNDALGAAFVKLLEAALPLVIRFADAMTWLLEKFASMPTGVAQAILGIGGAFFIAMRGVIGFGNVVGRIGTALRTIRTFFLALTGSRLWAGLVAGISRVGIALRTMFLSMTATPMGKFITGITLLVAAFVLAYQKSEAFRNAVNKVKDALAKVFGGSDNAMAAATFAPLLLGFTKLTGGASLFSKVLGPLRGAIMGVVTGIRTLTVAMLTNPIGIIIAAVVALGVALWAFFTKTETGRKIWAGFVDFLKKAWEGFKDIFGKVVDWIGDRWNGLVKFFTENKWIRALLNPIDTLKRGFQGMFDFAKGLFGNLKRILLEMLLAPARAVGRLFQKVPTWVPGSGRVRSFGAQLASVQVVERAEGGTIPKAVSRANNVLKGPGTPTSDSIIAVDDAGVPVARVSTDEGIVNAKGLRKHRRLFEAINRDDPRLANLPGFDKGGALSDIYRPLVDPPKGGGAPPPSQEGSAKQRLGHKAWDLEWQKYFREKGADTPQKAYDYMQTHLDVRDRYRRGDLPPAPVEGGWFEKMTPRKDDDKIAEDKRRRNDEQRVKEVKEREKREADRKRARRVFDEAWYKWFEEHGGDDNKESYLARNPEVAERWRTGVFPPGDERRQEDLTFNPDGSLSDESKPFDLDSGFEENLEISSGDPSGYSDYSGGGDWDPWNSPSGDANGSGGTSKLQEAAQRAVAAGEAKGIDVAVQISDPDTGMSYFAGKQGQFPAASVIKLLVAAAAAKAVDENRLSADQVRPVLNPMISQSSNDATNQMIDMLGGIDAVNQAGASFGISGEDAHLGRKLGVPVQGEDPNRMTARGVDSLLTLFSQSARGKLPEGKEGLSKSSAQMVVDAMKAQTVDTKFGANLPNDKIAHKTGELGGASHDTGYFFDGERWLQVSILTNKPGASSQEANNEIIRAFGKEAFESRGEAPNIGSGASPSGTQSGIPSGEALDRANAFVNAQIGKGYQSPPNPPANWDCSMLMSGIYAALTGQNTNQRFFTTEGGPKGEFDKYGFVPGLIPGAFQIGIMRGGGGPNSHMSGTMPNGDNVESGGRNGVVTRGPSAAGANDPQYKLHFSLPPDRWNPPAKMSDPNNTGADDLGSISLENVDPGPDGILGTDDDIALDMGDDGLGGSSKDSDPGIQESASISDAMVNGVFSPRRFALNVGAKASGILFDGALSFFGLENSILSDNNTYTKAISDAAREQERVDKERRKKKDQYGRDLDAKDKTRQRYEPRTGNVGSGEEGTQKDYQLKMGYSDPTTAPAVQKAVVPKQTPEGGIAEGTPGAKEAFYEEWKKHGWTDPQNWFDTLRLYNGESSWNERAKNPSSTAEGIPQFLEATRRQFGWGPTARDQAGPAARYLKARPDYGSPSKAYAMWKSRSPHWYADGGYVSGPGGPRDDEIEARLSNGEFVVNAASTEKAGPLLEAINASPAAAEQALNMLSGPVGAALNGVAPGAGVAASAVLSQAGSVAESALRPAANTAIGFLSEVERSNFTARHQAPAQMTVEPKKHTPPMQKSFNSGTININTLDHRSMIREFDDMSARDAMRHVNI